MDEGPPSSYLLLAKDTPVFGSDGSVAGKVKEVLCDPGDDIFDGLVLRARSASATSKRTRSPRFTSAALTSRSRLPRPFNYPLQYRIDASSTT